MKRKIELAYSRALVPVRGKFLKKVAICLLVVILVMLIIYIK